MMYPPDAEVEVERLGRVICSNDKYIVALEQERAILRDLLLQVIECREAGNKVGKRLYVKICATLEIDVRVDAEAAE